MGSLSPPCIRWEASKGFQKWDPFFIFYPESGTGVSGGCRKS